MILRLCFGISRCLSLRCANGCDFIALADDAIGMMRRTFSAILNDCCIATKCSIPPSRSILDEGGSRIKWPSPVFRSISNQGGGSPRSNAIPFFLVQPKIGGGSRIKCLIPLSHSIQSDGGRSWIKCHIPLSRSVQNGGGSQTKCSTPLPVQSNTKGRHRIKCSIPTFPYNPK